MSQPLVCCICLTADRQNLTERAIRCFLAQTYPKCWLLVYDSGATQFELPPWATEDRSRVVLARAGSMRGASIGELRNAALALTPAADIIAHWDSDDWSAPERIATQVQFLDYRYWVTGFQNALFSDTLRGGQAWEYDATRSGIGKVIGATLLYRREAWQQHPFDPTRHTGEDTEWVKHFQVLPTQGVVPSPLFVADVHGKNTSKVYTVFENHQPAFQPEWRRVPEWDAFCRERIS